MMLGLFSGSSEVEEAEVEGVGSISDEPLVTLDEEMAKDDDEDALEGLIEDEAKMLLLL